MNAVIEIIVSFFLTIGTAFSLIPDMMGGVKTYEPENESVILKGGAN